MEVLCHVYNPGQWRLFIDSSKVSLNVVLLHNGNSFPSVPFVHAANMKESYESIWESLSMKNFSVCGELKVVVLLSECNLCTQNTALSCASGAAG
jgi:hypothetical protein